MTSKAWYNSGGTVCISLKRGPVETIGKPPRDVWAYRKGPGGFEACKEPLSQTCGQREEPLTEGKAAGRGSLTVDRPQTVLGVSRENSCFIAAI